jgi:hypothetical protein
VGYAHQFVFPLDLRLRLFSCKLPGWKKRGRQILALEIRAESYYSWRFDKKNILPILWQRDI